MTLPEPVREALEIVAENLSEGTARAIYEHIVGQQSEIELLRGKKAGWQGRCDQWQQHAEEVEAKLATLTAERDALAQRCAELADDFRGCAEHSRHKQAAEAWNYCADKIAAIHQETRHAG